MRAALPPNEAARLQALYNTGILDTMPEQAYDDITTLASFICETPMAAITLIDAERQWLKSKVGLSYNEDTRDQSFCAHTILEPEHLTVVPDTRHDLRFSDNPYVIEEGGIRFYAGAPLVTTDGFALGSLCVIDRVPRQLSPMQLAALQSLSRQVMSQFSLRRQGLELQQLNEKLELLATQDGLTGVSNRRAFDLTLRREWRRAHRSEHPLSLLLLDIDNFKSYNDTFGHQAGDDILRTVGSLLQKNVKETDSVARYGGEEFAVILPDTDAAGALVAAERLRVAFENSQWPLRVVTCSLGIATLTSDSALEEPSAMVEASDKALYHSKRTGRNRATHIDALSTE